MLVPPAPKPATKAPKRTKPSVRERFDALRNLKLFLAQIWAASPALTLATLSLRLVGLESKLFELQATGYR